MKHIILRKIWKAKSTINQWYEKFKLYRWKKIIDLSLTLIIYFVTSQLFPPFHIKMVTLISHFTGTCCFHSTSIMLVYN